MMKEEKCNDNYKPKEIEDHLPRDANWKKI